MWLISQETWPDSQENCISSDGSLLLVLVSSRIEIDVLLNELIIITCLELFISYSLISTPAIS